MESLPVDVIYIICEYITGRHLILFTLTCRRYYLLRDRILNIRVSKMGPSIEQNLFPLDTSIWRLRSFVCYCIEKGLWYITWKDITPSLQASIEGWIQTFSERHPKYTFSRTEYVLQTTLYLLWKMRSIYSHVLPIVVRIEYDPHLVSFIMEKNFGFRLTMFILLRMTSHKYGRLVEEHCRRYYDRKINKVKNNEDHFTIISTIKPHYPQFYYDRLLSLHLSHGRWTDIFIQEVKLYRTRVNKKVYGKLVCSYFNRFRDLREYFESRYSSMDKREIRKRVDVDVTDIY